MEVAAGDRRTGSDLDAYDFAADLFKDEPDLLPPSRTEVEHMDIPAAPAALLQQLCGDEVLQERASQLRVLLRPLFVEIEKICRHAGIAQKQLWGHNQSPAGVR